MLKIISKMGPIRCKLEQLLRESEGSFGKVKGYFLTNARFVQCTYTCKKFLDFYLRV